MIEIFRTAEPGILKKMGAKWTTAIKTAKTKSDRDKAIEKYKHRQIKEAISLML